MIVLDTHIWIWANQEPERIPKPIRKAIKAEEEGVLLSAISVWETILAIEKGRVSSNFSPEITVRKWLNANPVQVVPIDAHIAFLSRSLSFDHEDPADRFIAATTVSRNAALASVDPQLIKLDWLKTISFKS